MLFFSVKVAPQQILTFMLLVKVEVFYAEKEKEPDGRISGLKRLKIYQKSLFILFWSRFSDIFYRFNLVFYCKIKFTATFIQTAVGCICCRLHWHTNQKTMKLKICEQYIMLAGIPAVGFLLSFVYLPKGQPYSFVHFCVSLIMTAVYWVGDVKILKFYRKLYSSIDETAKRIVFTVLTIVIFNAVVDLLLCSWLNNLAVKPDSVTKLAFLERTSVNFLTSFVIGTLYETNYFFSRWKNQALETEQLKSQQLKSQLNVLKNQISPHFLFNSLNTLIALIAEDQRNAINFTERLSYVYRYILQNKDKEVIDLATELAFTKSYLYLLKTRFTDSLQLNINIQEELLSCYVAPLTLQMLIENAVKHNIVSANKPLKIELFVENGDTLVVKNNLQMKSATEPSTHTGLTNIKTRYAYLSNRPVNITICPESFMVTLPLIVMEPTFEVA